VGNSTIFDNGTNVFIGGTSSYSSTSGFSRLMLPTKNLNFCIYSKTNITQTANDISGYLQDPFDMFMRIKDASNSILGADGGIFLVTANPNPSTGLYSLNSINGTNASKVIRNGNTSSPIGVFTAGNSSNFINIQMGQGTTKNIAFYGIGLSLTDTQMQDDYTQIQALQTAFSRQV
jgi:hypothetical protein